MGMAIAQTYGQDFLNAKLKIFFLYHGAYAMGKMSIVTIYRELLWVGNSGVTRGVPPYDEHSRGQDS